MRVRARENSLEARKTLAGIVRLVSKIKEMKVGKGVRDKVLGAVERLEKVRARALFFSVEVVPALLGVEYEGLCFRDHVFLFYVKRAPRDGSRVRATPASPSLTQNRWTRPESLDRHSFSPAMRWPLQAKHSSIPP